ATELHQSILTERPGGPGVFDSCRERGTRGMLPTASIGIRASGTHHSDSRLFRARTPSMGEAGRGVKPTLSRVDVEGSSNRELVVISRPGAGDVRSKRPNDTPFHTRRFGQELPHTGAGSAALPNTIQRGDHLPITGSRRELN